MSSVASTPSVPEPARPRAVPEILPELLVFFDGDCAFCDRSVRAILAREPEDSGSFWFAPLQGATAARVRARWPAFPDDVDTVVLLERRDGEERLYLRSQAVLRIAALLELGHPLWWSALARLPRWLSDAGYRAFAASRYRLFGRVDSCALPSRQHRDRVLA